MPTTVLVASLLTVWAADGPPLEHTRRITFPWPGDDSRKVRTQVIESREQLNALLKSLNRRNDFDRGGGKDDYPEFAKALAAAKVDFEREILVIIRHDEGSGSVRVRFHLTEEADGTLCATIRREIPPRLNLMSMPYCFAFVARKDWVKQLVLWEVIRVGPTPLPPLRRPDP